MRGAGAWKGALWLGLAVFGAMMATGLAAAGAKAGAFTKGKVAYAVGETVKVVAPRDQAELQAMRDAIERLSKLLERKGYGKQRELATGVENALTRESDLAQWKLGKARIDSVLQQRWEAPDGKDAWSVKVKISVSLR